MIEDIRVVEWVEVVTEFDSYGEPTGTTTKERYDIEVKRRDSDMWVSVPRFAIKRRE